MSIITDLIYSGSGAVAGMTESAVNEAAEKYGASQKIAFPETEYSFPAIYAVTGVRVSSLGELPACVARLKGMIANEPSFDSALHAGLAFAAGAEILEGLKYLHSADPYEKEPGIGFLPDSVIRRLGGPLAAGDIPGVAMVLGKADKAADVVSVVKDYQGKGILTLLVGACIEQCLEAGVRTGPALRILPLGHDVTSMIHGYTAAIRTALIFGCIQPGNLPELRAYTGKYVPAFVNTFGAIDSVAVSACACAIALGFPAVVDIDLGANQIPGVLESVCDHQDTVKKSLELRRLELP